MNINPSISKNRVKEEVVLSVNWELPDAAGNVVINVATTIDPSSNNLISSSVDGLYADKRAGQHSYDGTVSGLWAITTQWAIDELKWTQDVIQNNITSINGTISDIQTDITNVQWDITTLENNKLESVTDTLSVNLTKTGTNLSADVTLSIDTTQLIEVTSTWLLADKRASAHTYDWTVSGLTAPNVQAAIDQLTVLITSSGWDSYTGIAWESISDGSAVYMNTDGKIYLAGATTWSIWFAKTSAALNWSITVQVLWVANLFSNLVVGMSYYLEVMDTWSDLSSVLPIGKSQQAIFKLWSKIYLVGWDENIWSFTKNVNEFDATTWVVTPKNLFPIFISAWAWFVLDGIAYVCGWNFDNFGAAVSNRLYQYDPLLDSWTQKANMPAPREGWIFGWANGKLYYIGWQALSGWLQSTVFEYTVSSDTWSTKASTYPVPNRDTGYATYNDKIYITTGRTSGINTDTQIYDTTNDTWSTGTVIPTWVADPAFISVGKYLYIIGGNTNLLGWSSWAYQAIVQVYDMDLNTWTTKAPMIHTQQYASAEFYDNNIYVFGWRWLPSGNPSTYIQKYIYAEVGNITTDITLWAKVWIALTVNELLIKN